MSYKFNKWNESDENALIAHFKNGLEFSKILKKLPDRSERALRLRMGKILYDELQHSTMENLIQKYKRTEEIIQLLIDEYSKQHDAQEQKAKIKLDSNKEINKEINKAVKIDDSVNLSHVNNTSYVGYTIVNRTLEQYLEYVDNLYKLDNMKQHNILNETMYNKIKKSLSKLHITDDMFIKCLDDSVKNANSLIHNVNTTHNIILQNTNTLVEENIKEDIKENIKEDIKKETNEKTTKQPGLYRTRLF